MIRGIISFFFRCGNSIKITLNIDLRLVIKTTHKSSRSHVNCYPIFFIDCLFPIMIKLLWSCLPPLRLPHCFFSSDICYEIFKILYIYSQMTLNLFSIFYCVSYLHSDFLITYDKLLK